MVSCLHICIGIEKLMLKVKKILANVPMSHSNEAGYVIDSFEKRTESRELHFVNLRSLLHISSTNT